MVKSGSLKGWHWTENRVRRKGSHAPVREGQSIYQGDGQQCKGPEVGASCMRWKEAKKASLAKAQ